MREHRGHKMAFGYIAAVTIFAVALIALNAWLHWHLRLSVFFLAGYIATLSVYCVWHAILTMGWRGSLRLFGLFYAVAFTAEVLGVNFGWIFGSYHYTRVFGLRLLGVPLLAALAWGPILYAAFLLIDLVAPSTVKASDLWISRLTTHAWTALVGALAATAWDMMIDPIAVSNGWWVWDNGGSYMPYLANGVPIHNFAGWLLVSFVIIFVARGTAGTDRGLQGPAGLTAYGALTLYASLFSTSMGVATTILIRPEVALVGMLAMGPFLAISITNMNLVQRGLTTLAGMGWLKLES